MTKTFVAINDSVHNLIRKVTHRTPLRPSPESQKPQVIEYLVQPEELPDEYYSLAMLHAVGGMPLEALPQARWKINSEDREGIPEQVNYFDAVKLDKRCARDLRLKPSKSSPGMLACELLAFGTGMLRARNDVADDPVHRYLSSQHGRISSRHEEVYASIRTLHRNPLPLPADVRKECFDSTNVIYGDALGELEQLWDRRADTVFLGQVAKNLDQIRTRGEVVSHLRPPCHLQAVFKLHLQRQAIWKTPPLTARALLHRIEFILENTVMDHSPATAFRWRATEPSCRQNHKPDETSGTGIDFSGNDGWLNADNQDSD